MRAMTKEVDIVHVREHEPGEPTQGQRLLFVAARLGPEVVLKAMADSVGDPNLTVAPQDAFRALVAKALLQAQDLPKEPRLVLATGALLQRRMRAKGGPQNESAEREMRTQRRLYGSQDTLAQGVLDLGELEYDHTIVEHGIYIGDTGALMAAGIGDSHLLRNFSPDAARDYAAHMSRIGYNTARVAALHLGTKGKAQAEHLIDPLLEMHEPLVKVLRVIRETLS